MTGLNPKKDKILSIGYVAISDSSIVMDSMHHAYVYHEKLTLGQSATIHGIQSTDIENGEPLEDVIDNLLEIAAGKVLVFHNATLDMGFLNNQIKQQYGFNLPVRYIDTLQVEHRRLKRGNQHLNPKLRLDDCRERYHLPRYKAHNAAIDALATAELWLAQLAHTSNGKNLALKYFL
jgi:DNA polymerase-3 subunit epsilon